jgi:hypothetical protein
MKRDGIHIDIDVSEWLDLLDAHEGPGPESVAAMSAVLGEIATELDLRVPVDTGSLRASQKVGTELRSYEGEWHGTVEYGGSSYGPKGIVVYARQAIHHSRAFDGIEEAYADDFTDAMGADVRARLK